MKRVATRENDLSRMHHQRYARQINCIISTPKHDKLDHITPIAVTITTANANKDKRQQHDSVRVLDHYQEWHCNYIFLLAAHPCTLLTELALCIPHGPETKYGIGYRQNSRANI